MNIGQYLDTRLNDELRNKFERLQFDIATKTLALLATQDKDERNLKSLELEIILSEVKGIEWTIGMLDKILQDLVNMENDEEENKMNSFILNMEKLFDSIPMDEDDFDEDDFDEGDIENV